MQQKINKGYVNHYETIKFTQTLPSGRHIWVTYYKTPNKKWYARYKTDSAYFICPYSGRFINCKDCEAYSEDKDNDENCLKTVGYITSEEMAARARDCMSAEGCIVEFMGF